MREFSTKLLTLSDMGLVKAISRAMSIVVVPIFLWVLSEMQGIEYSVSEKLENIAVLHNKLNSRLVAIETEHDGIFLPIITRHEKLLDRLQVDRPRFDLNDAKDMKKELNDKIKEIIQYHEQNLHYNSKLNP